jgi:hypothetical protein
VSLRQAEAFGLNEAATSVATIAATTGTADSEGPSWIDNGTDSQTPARHQGPQPSRRSTPIGAAFILPIYR